MRFRKSLTETKNEKDSWTSITEDDQVDKTTNSKVGGYLLRSSMDCSYTTAHAEDLLSLGITSLCSRQYSLKKQCALPSFKTQCYVFFVDKVKPLA